MYRGTWSWTRKGLLLIVIAGVAALAAACGSSSSSSSSGDAQSLLKQTFSGSHTVKSGVLDFDLSLAPSGSSTLTSPITLSIHGPFQSRGTGTLPASSFTLSAGAMGHSGSFGVVSTGTAGYVSLQGTSYQLPQAQFQKLESSFSSASSGSGGGPGLSELGINPLDWVKSPTVVGTEQVGGADTTHIRADVDVAALLGDLNTFLAKESKNQASTTKLPVTIPQATQDKIAAEVKNATLDVWTGTSDKTVRKLDLKLNVPVSGKISTLLGGLSGAGINLSVQYSDLNQPQTIATPTNVHPYSEFATKLQGVVGALEGSVGGGLGSTGAGAGATGSTGSTGSSGSAGGSSSAPSSKTVTKYSSCIQQAGGDVTKMQKCAALLSGGG